MRRTAKLTVAQQGDRVVARVRVDVERKDTSRVSAQGHSFNPSGDSPGVDTPINRDAATTEQQNTLWTHVKRDFSLERSILDELRERMARLAPESESFAEPAAGDMHPAANENQNPKLTAAQPKT